ncbi:PH domain-containing protein [uncultured Methanoregula sp.]|uniref:PH domain-containing protein n=1 Tax=uncultured Methanoregula sp. TaxID=1005933 RepID=UPI0037494DCC
MNIPFKPAAALKTSLMVNGILFLLLILCCSVFPLILASEMSSGILILCSIIIVAIVVICLAWIHLYYESMWYELREDEMSWKRGIWFRTTGIVPYNRITNLDVRQGPVMRALGISTLAIQTAGYSGQVASEIKIEGVEKAEDLREFIRSMVRVTALHGDGTGGEKALPVTADQKILDELIRIRILLEEQKKQGK